MYEKNERVIVKGSSPLGELTMVFVGALNVGELTRVYSAELR